MVLEGATVSVLALAGAFLAGVATAAVLIALLEGRERRIRNQTIEELSAAIVVADRAARRDRAEGKV